MKTDTPAFSRYQKWVMALLALTQFSVVLDFMVMSPLGDMLMKDMKISPRQFGLVVSAYAFSAGASGLLTAGFADRFDRKKLLLFFYTGFIAGTFFCGVAGTYHWLVIARIFTGIFGGVIGSISLAIVTDLFSMQQRGRVMGLIQMGFGASQVLGIPISLFIANYYGWEAPFFLVVGIAICVALGILTIMQPVDKHLALQGAHTNPVQHLLNTVAKRDYRIGFTATALLAIGGFMMMPFSSAFAVNNLKVSTHDLPALFMISGVTSLVVMPILGRLSDKFDRFKIFAIAALYMSVVIVLYTHLTPKPLWFVMGFNVLMMAGILGRMVPASAIVTAVPGPADRGAFMSINSSLQQIAGGIAAMIGGLIVYRQSEVSPLEHYDVLGYVVAGITLLSIYLIGRVDKMIKKRLPADDTTQPVIEEHQPA